MDNFEVFSQIFMYFIGETSKNEVSVAKEGKVLEQKKPLEPLLGTPEGIYRGCTISFSTSTALVVYPNGQCVGKYGQ